MTNKCVLLHICCGVCASSVIERLRDDGFEVAGFFYNPNIYPAEEYSKRLEAAAIVAKHFGIQMIEGEYDHNLWLSLTKGLEKEPEGGARCEICFRMRLEEAWRKCCEMDVPHFAATLTVSPHKDALLINRIGSQIGRGHSGNDTAFLEYDFKKQDGFRKAMEFSRQHLLYRQKYCGCEYSNNVIAQ